MNWYFWIGVYWLVSIPVAVFLGRLLTEFPNERPEFRPTTRNH